MTLVQKIIEALTKSPMSNQEMEDKFGGSYTCTVARLMKRGVIESFDVKVCSREYHCRSVIKKYRVVGEYHKDVARVVGKAARCKAYLEKHGYTVMEPASK